MRKFFLLASLLVCGLVAMAQDDDFEFPDRSDEMEDITVPSYEKKHYLGADFTKMFFALKEQYVYIPETTSINRDPSPTTEKPAIYNAIKKLDRYYKKMLKKGKMSKEDVQDKLARVVSVGYSIRHANTAGLEKMLWSIKDMNKLESVFTEKIVLN